MPKSAATDTFGALREEFLTFDTCLVSDALERLALPRGVGGLPPLTVRRRIFGRAITVRLEQHDGNVAKRHLGTAAVDVGEVGDIIVVQHESRQDCAGWGGLLSTAASARGIMGVVCSGPVRDVDECVDLDLPLFAPTATPVTARNRVSEVTTNEPISLCGTPVAPRDYILADSSGIAIIPADRVLDVRTVAREMLAFENEIRAQIAQGTPISKAMNRAYETLLTRPAQ